MAPMNSTSETTGIDALESAIDMFGSVSALALAIGVTTSAITNWIRRGKVPSHQCAKIEVATKCSVTRQRLRPDFFATYNDLPKAQP